jgi:hypothetical protein
MAAVVDAMVKRCGILITSCGDEKDECKRTADDASKKRSDGIKTGELLCPRKSMADTYLLAMRCPIDRSTGNGRSRLVLAEGGSLQAVARAG